MCVILGNRHRRRIAVRCLAVVLWSGCQARNFFARRQREGREGPLRNRRLRRDVVTGGGIKCFRHPRAAAPIRRDHQSKIADRQVPRRRHSDSPWRFVVPASCQCGKNERTRHLHAPDLHAPLARTPRVSPRRWAGLGHGGRMTHRFQSVQNRVTRSAMDETGQPQDFAGRPSVVISVWGDNALGDRDAAAVARSAVVPKRLRLIDRPLACFVYE